jgi:hypothetical protein
MFLSKASTDAVADDKTSILMFLVDDQMATRATDSRYHAPTDVQTLSFFVIVIMMRSHSQAKVVLYFSIIDVYCCLSLGIVIRTNGMNSISR